MSRHAKLTELKEFSWGAIFSVAAFALDSLLNKLEYSEGCLLISSDMELRGVHS
jgi:hypothetical protein